MPEVMSIAGALSNSPTYTDGYCESWAHEEETLREPREVWRITDGREGYTFYCWDCICREANQEGDSAMPATDEYGTTDLDETGDYAVVELPPSRMTLPGLVARTPRLVSFEQELSAGARSTARALHGAGYAASSEVLGYHSGRGSGLCYVEEDGSCDGEVIYSKMDLSSPYVARRFEDALSIVRNQVKSGEAEISMSCGAHVHIGIQGFSMENVESLYHLWNYLEDTCYRIAASHWSRHRDSGGGYASPLQKGHSTKRAVGHYLNRSRGALNLSNYLSARGHCSCGAFDFAEWESCVCDLPKATAEFRVWNATTNLRKIHAFTALSLAIVEYAARNRVTAADYPAFDRELSSEPNEENSRERIEFILRKLVLTREELEDVRYCLDNSSLSKIHADMNLRLRTRNECRQVA